MADLALLEDAYYAPLRRERVFQDRRDLLNESDEWLMSRFRLPRHLLLEMCNNLEPYLQRETRRSRALPVPVQVLSTLGFLATGTFQREIAVRSGISQHTMSRMLSSVLAAIRTLIPQYIQFPYDNAQQTMIKRGFYEIAGIPNVIGAIDCTHVRLKPPSVNDYAYINRKNYHSVNVQIICDARLCLLNVVARWPGGTHDAFIFEHSSVRRRLQEGALRGHGYLLGDRGYPLLDFLITPVPNPVTHQERNFNHAHARTRATVERCVGLLKGRWLCLAHAGGTLLYSPEKVCNIILACAVLHNMAEINRVPFDALAPDPEVPVEQWAAPPALGAVQLRRDLVRRF
ncbi:putative nuclease HARBI1 [Sander lucioperca]|uniref:putative nuclease HARBI1 n=1 Tax=Sander lucioperca TaxID=283035 RepID=UPI001653AB15|nr:putative nuclease HARBI1 [Sander lucioperca]